MNRARLEFSLSGFPRMKAVPKLMALGVPFVLAEGPTILNVDCINPSVNVVFLLTSCPRLTLATARRRRSTRARMLLSLPRVFTVRAAPELSSESSLGESDRWRWSRQAGNSGHTISTETVPSFSFSSEPRPSEAMPPYSPKNSSSSSRKRSNTSRCGAWPTPSNSTSFASGIAFAVARPNSG